MPRTATRPFEFVDCLELREMLGRSAWDERELLHGIEEVPAASIFYHTHSAFLRSRYLPAPYRNDFATWAAIQVRDRVLGERLAVVDPFDYEDVEALRGELITIIDDHLSDLQVVPRIVYGEPFEFMRAQLIAVPTGIRATTLREFREALARVDLSAIYYHFFRAEARRGTWEAVRWLAEELGEVDLAERIRKLNPYISGLDGLRARLLALCDARLAHEDHA
ncbi:MAG: DUF5752 family protein [Armatimonadota bacterium]|nr:DUF5752 family protein [Armatimonadota bacterium]MDR7451104.1 DUF5752 family protein [Armatimonadota bacterium]MDR7467291.1 DUF5752 family protein [Armatimonadota bacterium]MDR7494552.1 DUF5752 family protein [Armatimonadota bacterium]MDR7499871.1 DUF5752 family protein [Armatimonadota bacterium]